MTPRLRKALVAGGAAVVLVVALWLGRGGNTPVTTASRTAATTPRAASPAAGVVDVRLEVLGDTASALEPAARNPFRFEARRVQAPASGGGVPTLGGVRPGAVASGPPPLPPIPLRYIGLFDAPRQVGLVAILSDGRGNVFYGREGETIEGRYLVVQVSQTSTELSYLDGRGRQTIRLSGQ